VQYVFLNGVICPKSDAHISPDDRGFRFGDGVFESFPIIQGLPYLWEAHFMRLSEGLQALHITTERIHMLLPALITLIQRNKCHYGVGRIIISRGCGSKGYYPIANSPTLYMETSNDAPTIISEPPIAAIRLHLSQWQRWQPSHLPSHVKLTQGITPTLARIEAAEYGAEEALLLNQDGHIAEAASGNLIWQQQGVLFTPALSTGAVAGTMRNRLLTHFPQLITEVSAPFTMLQQADALIMTNALQGAVPVKEILHHHAFTQSEALANRCAEWIAQDILHEFSQLQTKLIAEGIINA
jgi:branched-subunit amino acid aminotransferase/4-amino-4-deoxychorismate lyase